MSILTLNADPLSLSICALGFTAATIGPSMGAVEPPHILKTGQRQESTTLGQVFGVTGVTATNSLSEVVGTTRLIQEAVLLIPSLYILVYSVDLFIPRILEAPFGP